MLTFEKVLEIFEDYLAQDMELEVYKSRYGYVCVSFNGSPPDPPYCEGDVCRTPEELFDHLLVEYESFASIQLTKGRREENEADEEQVLAPGAHGQFGSGKNTQFEPEQRANPFENVFSKTAVFPPPAIAETDL